MNILPNHHSQLYCIYNLSVELQVEKEGDENLCLEATHAFRYRLLSFFLANPDSICLSMTATAYRRIAMYKPARKRGER